MTIIPNYLISGIIGVIFSILTIYWSRFKISSRKGWIIQILFGICLLIFGSGFYSAFFAIITGFFSKKINQTGKKTEIQNLSRLTVVLAKTWPTLPILLIVSSLIQWTTGHLVNTFLLSISSFTFIMEWLVVFLSFSAAIAKDLIKSIDPAKSQQVKHS